MTFDNAFTLDRYESAARRQFQDARTRLEALDEALLKQAGGNSQSSLAAGLIGSLFFTAVYAAVFYDFGFRTDNWARPVALVLSLAMMACVIFSKCKHAQYYGSIHAVRNRVAGMLRQIELGEQSLSANLHSYESCRRSGWDCAITAADSVPDAMTAITYSMSTMESFRSGFLRKLTAGLFYLTGIAWSYVGIVVLEGVAYTFLGEIFGYDTIHVIAIIGMVVSMAAGILLSRYVLSLTGGTVNNLCLLATFAGPVLFVVLIGALALVITVVLFVVELIVALFALIFGGAILFGILCGGG